MNQPKLLLILLICLIAVSLFAQTPQQNYQSDSLRNAIIQELTPKIASELAKETAVYITYFTDRSPRVRKINGFIQNGRYLDHRHLVLPKWVIVLATMPRTIKTEKK